MNRRMFLASAASMSVLSTTEGQSTDRSDAPFKLKYAPGFGTFRAHAGQDPLDHIRFAADQGFAAMFDNDLMIKPLTDQERIGGEMNRRNMTLGPFVMYADWKESTLVTGKKEVREILVQKTREAVDCAKRTQCQWALLVPGLSTQRLAWEYQTAHVVDMLRSVADIAEPAGLTIVIEPLNWWSDHPGLFLTKISQAYQICHAVNRTCIKMVDDLYHQQITEGNLIPNIDQAWDQIAAFHLGDTPGRNEPGSGEINYKNVFKHIHSKGYTDVLCMEHGNSQGRGKAAEKALIEAYRLCDDF